MTGLFTQAKLRMEEIAFQPDHKVGPLLEEQVRSIYEKIKDGWHDFEIEKSDEVKAIEKIVFNEFGLKIQINASSPNPAAIIPFHLNENSVLMDDNFKGTGFLKEQEFLKDKSKTKSGWVDENKIKVGGIFSEYINTVYVNFNMLYKMLKRNVRKTVAVILHELGHGFYACAYTNRVDETNQIISAAMRKGAEASDNKVEVLYKEFKDKGMEIRKETLQGLTNKDPITLGKTAFQLTNEFVYSQMVSSKYNETSFEQLADNFAARLGYGKELVEALEDITPFGVRHNYLFMMYISAMNAWKIVNNILSCIFYFLNLTNKDRVFNIMEFFQIFKVIRIPLYSVVMLAYMVHTSGEAGKDYTYDDLVKRYNRIRNQLIEMIKKKQLSKSQANNVIRTIEQMGELIKGCSAYRGPLDFLFNTFNPKDRRAKSSIERQQAIEDLMSNPLFVVALKAKISAA